MLLTHVFSVLLYIHRDQIITVLGTGSPERPPWLSHISWALCIPVWNASWFGMCCFCYVMVLDTEFLLRRWSGVSFLFFVVGGGGEKRVILDNTKFLSVWISSCSHDSGFNPCCIVHVFRHSPFHSWIVIKPNTWKLHLSFIKDIKKQDIKKCYYVCLCFKENDYCVCDCMFLQWLFSLSITVIYDEQ